MLLRQSLRLVLRQPRRALAAAGGVAIASALLVSVILFGTASGATLTRRALADLPVDAQVVLARGTDAGIGTQLVSSDPAVKQVLPFDLAHFDRATFGTAGSGTSTSGGVLVGADGSYTGVTHLFAVSEGSVVPGQVLVSRDLATNLGAVPGDALSFALPGGAAASLTVSGIVDLTGADLILGPIDAAHRAAGANPPTNVAITDRGTLDTVVLPKISADAVAADPSSDGTTSPVVGGAPGPAGTVVAPEPAVRRELHVLLDRSQLPGDPGEAQKFLDLVRRRIERQAAGSLSFVDDATASLSETAKDLVWGQILFVFLALPGIALALVLSQLAAGASAEATRRDVALMRIRGATPRQLRAVFLLGLLFQSAIGAVIGAVTGVAVSFALFPQDLAIVDAGAAIVRAVVVAVVVVTALATVAAALPLRDQLREEVQVGRQEVQRTAPPLWQRLYLDVIAIVVGVAVYLAVGGSGVHPVLNAEGNPTVTLALTSFVAPLLLWVGAALFLLRVVLRALRRGQRLRPLLARLLGPGGDLAGRLIPARAGSLSRALVLLALATSFATSILMFAATYQQQQRVDAELTLGADIMATPAKSADATAVAAFSDPSIRSATPFVDRVVYVGPEAQDLLAIDPVTLRVTAPLADSFFKDQTAAAAMDALASQPDAILVSEETAHDYSIVPGDRVRIRIPDAQGTLHTVDFHMAGIALEFPTAPKDAFLVGNLSYLTGQTGDGRISHVLVKAGGDPAAVAGALRAQLGTQWQVDDITQTTARLANSITSVDLSALVRLDLGFALLIATVGVIIFLLQTLSERRRELATLEAIGAERRQLQASFGGELLVVGVPGALIGLITGAIVGYSLLQILAGVFDPPAQLPAVPVAGLAVVVVGVAAGLAVALGVAARALARISILSALRER